MEELSRYPCQFHEAFINEIFGIKIDVAKSLKHGYIWITSPTLFLLNCQEYVRS